MGAVYLAEHPLIGKKVALKVIHKELATNREVVQRFFQEAKAVNKIGSEHIVEIFDFGATPEGDHFFFMEFLEGRNLASVLAGESVLDVRRALHIGAQIASALGAAHAAGVIHRDLKPDNVMLTTRLGDQDYVKLLDFGLAKMFASDSASAVKTAAGVLLGTPQYMSPEACESRGNLDHRTDIYALGVLLFQMLTGQLPFDGETMGEILVKQVTQLPPPPRQLNPNIPPSVEQIVLRCLMKSPDARFPSMSALREALLDPENYLHRSPPMAPARSLAPGEIKVDAKTVMAYAAQQQKTRLGLDLPLSAPPSLAMNNPSAQATMISDGSLAPTKAPTIAAFGPNFSMPAQLKTNTMRIATPLGYSSQQPRKVWPIVLVAAVLLGLVGGGFAVAWFKKKNAVVTAVAIDAGPPAAADAAKVAAVKPPPVPVDAAVVITPVPTVAEINLDSVPSGAEIYDANNTLLGKTPTTFKLPISKDPVTIELRMAGFKKKTKQLVISENLVLQVQLDKLPPATTTTVPHHPPGQGKGSGKHGSPDDLEPP